MCRSSPLAGSTRRTRRHSCARVRRPWVSAPHSSAQPTSLPRRATSYDRHAMREVTDLRAAVVGTGFIGVVHVDALRRIGVQVLGVVGSSPERARAKGSPVPLPEPYESFDAMLADDRIDVVHLTTPNQLPLVAGARNAGAGKARSRREA